MSICHSPLREKTDAVVESHVKIRGKIPSGSSHCSSGVGKKPSEGKQQVVNLSIPGCMRYGTFVHEFVHAYGLYHEQQRSDRDDFITVDYNNIKKEGWPQFKICHSCTTYGVPYDGRSLMHYVSNAYAIDHSKPAMISKVTFSVFLL